MHSSTVIFCIMILLLWYYNMIIFVLRISKLRYCNNSNREDSGNFSNKIIYTGFFLCRCFLRVKEFIQKAVNKKKLRKKWIKSDVSNVFPDTKEFIEKNVVRMCSREHISVEEGYFCLSWFHHWWLPMFLVAYDDCLSYWAKTVLFWL